MNLIRKFLRDESGATAIEYVLIGGLVSIVIIGGVTAVGTKLNNNYLSKILPALN
jgi:pilus assembly protein Flp/PilA